MSIVAVEKTFTTGPQYSDPILLKGKFSFTLDLNGGTGTFQLQRSYDGGTTYIPVYNPNVASFNMTASESLMGEEPERGGAYYRGACTNFGSGSPKIKIAY